MVTNSKVGVQQLKKLDLQMLMKPVEQKVIVYQKTKASDLEYK